MLCALFEYPQHRFLSGNKKNIHSFWIEKAPYLDSVLMTKKKYHNFSMHSDVNLQDGKSVIFIIHSPPENRV